MDTVGGEGDDGLLPDAGAVTAAVAVAVWRTKAKKRTVEESRAFEAKGSMVESVGIETTKKRGRVPRSLKWTAGRVGGDGAGDVTAGA